MKNFQFFDFEVLKPILAAFCLLLFFIKNNLKNAQKVFFTCFFNF
eukprot:UN21711